jgi:uncharacterized membrane protein
MLQKISIPLTKNVEWFKLRLMKKITDIFFRGLVTLLPIVITFYILYSGIIILENLLGHFLRNAMGDFYIPGLGLIVTAVIIFLFGLLMTHFISKSIWDQIETRLTKVPLIKALYSPLKDLMGLFSSSGQKQLKSVVLVEVFSGAKMLGLVTRDRFDDIAELNQADFKSEDHQKVAVYIPLSYALGGFTVLIDRDKIQKIDVPVERALSLAITGWVKSNSEGN